MAVDVIPYPIDWENITRFYRFGGFVKAIAVMLGIPLIWGGDWQKFKDLPHFELTVLSGGC